MTEEQFNGNIEDSHILKGTILKGIGGLYHVYGEDTGLIYQCSARGIFRKNDTKPLIGDAVQIGEIDPARRTAAIIKIEERKNELRRPTVANVDKLLFVAASVNPKPDLLLLDKMIITAERSNIEFLFMINKSDQDLSAAEELYAQYAPAVKCFITSAGQPESILPVKNEIAGTRTVIAGQSGAGKSTFINTIAGCCLMDTGGLSKKTDRGRHTTRHAELFMVAEGFERPAFIIDSPGFSMLTVETMEPQHLQEYYPEMYNNKRPCKFMDCCHTGEPGCFVQDLLASGKIHPERYVRYVRIYKELAENYKNRYR